MGDCPFCQPCYENVFYRGDRILGLLNGYPVTNGHGLLINQRHVVAWFSASAAEQQELTAAVTVARDAILTAGHPPDGFHIGINAGESAGQIVLHLHVIPRYRGDGTDPRRGVRHVVPAKANYFGEHRVVTGRDDPLLRQAHRELDGAQRTDITGAFVSLSGGRTFQHRFSELLELSGRLITGDYGSITEREALIALLGLVQNQASSQFRVGEYDPHPKFYLFERADGSVGGFVGRSNLTSQGLLDRGLLETPSRFPERRSPTRPASCTGPYSTCPPMPLARTGG